jgi:hypothetical protein
MGRLIALFMVNVFPLLFVVGVIYTLGLRDFASRFDLKGFVREVFRKHI